MKTLLFLAFVMTAISCSTVDSNENYTGLEGEWVLKEELFDIGDGKGTYKLTSRDMKITFLSNGTYKATGSFCPGSSGNSTGSFNLVKHQLIPDECKNTAILDFLVEGNTLIISPMCVEKCGLKFVKANSTPAKD